MSYVFCTTLLPAFVWGVDSLFGRGWTTKQNLPRDTPPELDGEQLETQKTLEHSTALWSSLHSAALLTPRHCPIRMAHLSSRNKSMLWQITENWMLTFRWADSFALERDENLIPMWGSGEPVHVHYTSKGGDLRCHAGCTFHAKKLLTLQYSQRCQERKWFLSYENENCENEQDHHRVPRYTSTDPGNQVVKKINYLGDWQKTSYVLCISSATYYKHFVQITRPQN